MKQIHNSYWSISAIVYKFKLKFHYVKNDLLNDLTHSKILWYTIQGLWLTLTKNVYWKFLLFFLIFYIIAFTLVATLLYIIIIPWGLGLSIILLGPLGALLLHIQWILISNMISNHLCKKLLLPNLNWQIYKLTISRCNCTQHQILMQNYENPNLNKQLNDWWWIIYFLKWISKYSFKMCLIFFSFIPLLGPFIVDIFETNDRTRKCLQPFFKEQNWSKKQIKQFEIMNKGDFILFGIIIGIFDSIPLFSVITITSNIVAGALWASDILKSDYLTNKQKKKKTFMGE